MQVGERLNARGSAASSGVVSEASSTAISTTGAVGMCPRHGWDVFSVKS